MSNEAVIKLIKLKTVEDLLRAQGEEVLDSIEFIESEIWDYEREHNLGIFEAYKDSDYYEQIRFDFFSNNNYNIQLLLKDERVFGLFLKALIYDEKYNILDKTHFKELIDSYLENQ